MSYKSADILINEKLKLEVVEGNIYYIRYADNITIEVEDIKIVKSFFDSLPEPKPLFTVSEFGVYSSITPEARTYAADISPNLLKSAYVIKGLAQRLLV